MSTAPRAIHHLSCGTLCPRGARLVSGEGGLRERARLVCHCLLIEGAEGLVLVDTGFGLDDVRTAAAARGRRSARSSARVWSVAEHRHLPDPRARLRPRRRAPHHHHPPRPRPRRRPAGLPRRRGAPARRGAAGRPAPELARPRALRGRALGPRSPLGRAQPVGAATAGERSGSASRACACCPAATPRSC